MAWVFSLILHNMERRIRKLIRVSAITVGALLLTGFVVVAFVINYVFTPDKLTPIVLNVANRSLDADLKVESVELTFFSTFPQFGLKVDEGFLVSKVLNDSLPQKTDSLLAFKECVLIVNPLDYFLKNKISVYNLSLKNVAVYAYRNKAGKANWEIVKTSSDTLAVEKDTISQNKFDSEIDIRQVELEHANLIFDDRNTEVYSRIDDVDLRLKLALTKGVSSLGVEFENKNILFWQQGELLINNAIKRDSNSRSRGILGARRRKEEQEPMRKLEQYQPEKQKKGEQTGLISVIVTVYNIREYLPKAVDSILSSTYHNLEVLLIDDGSTDGSERICDEYAKKDGRVWVVHQRNGGAYSARNTGLLEAKGDYLTFVDGDDWIEPQMYETLLAAMMEQDADLAVCRYRKIYENRRVDLSTPMAAVFEGQELLAKYLEEDEAWLIQTAVWNKLWKRSLSDGLRFPKSLYEDMYFTIRLLAKSKRSVYLDWAMYNYVCSRATSTTNIGLNEKTFNDLIPNFYERSAFLREIGREDLALLQDYFLYKRLLLFYTAVCRSQDPKKKEHKAFLQQKIEAGKDCYAAVYGIPQASSQEYRKMKLFLKSPILYRAAMRLNDSFLIPIKVAMANRRQR